MRGIISSVLLLLTASASAAPIVVSPPNAKGISLARRPLPARGIAAGTAESKTIYLNHTGVTLRPGDDDARTNRSSIISGQVSVPAWNTSDETWAATVACFKDLWKEFDVTITDQDPGDVPHMEAVFGGSPQNIGMPSGVGGVSPFTLDCAVIENSIVFTFTNAYGNDAQTICEVMSQEVAHSYGLDHEMLASDPMTYLNYNGKRSFKDQTASCGEYSNRLCGIDGSVCRQNQNSVALLEQRLGVADLVAPTLTITSPADGATVQPGFEIAATAEDERGVTEATLYVDDIAVDTAPGAGPYSFPTDAELAVGDHAIRIEVTDGRNVKSATIAVTLRIDDSGSDDESKDDASGDVTGGCSTGGGAGLGMMLALLLVRRRSRDT